MESIADPRRADERIDAGRTLAGGTSAQSAAASTLEIFGYAVTWRAAATAVLMLAAVLFRYAENAYFMALATEKKQASAERTKTLARLTEEAGKRYQEMTPEQHAVNRHTSGSDSWRGSCVGFSGGISSGR